jgi:hypothetical protein
MRTPLIVLTLIAGLFFGACSNKNRRPSEYTKAENGTWTYPIGILRLMAHSSFRAIGLFFLGAAIRDPSHWRIHLISKRTGNVEYADTAGMNDYVTKPFNPLELQTKILRVLSR